MEPQSTMPPPPTQEYCYRHPGVATGVHCTRCNRPICTECMVAAPVGYQCPECVAEAQRQFRRGPGRRIAIANAKSTSATKALLVILVAVFIVELIVGGPGSLLEGPSSLQLIRLGATIGLAQLPGGLVGIAVGQSWRLFTAMFLHAGLLHLAFNAYALWIFGQMIEEEMGRTRLLAIYLLTGLCGGAVSYAFGPLSVPGVGASGAIFGLFGAFVAYNWRRRHTALGQARLRAAIMLLIINAVIGFAAANIIDWRAHAGGFAAGLLAGFAAEGFGMRRYERSGFVVGCVGIAIVTVGLVVWRTAQIHALLPGLF